VGGEESVLLTVDHRGNTLIARLSGELDLQVADELRTRLDRALDERVTANLVFNLEAVSFVDSSCFGVILGRYKRISGGSGEMVFVSTPPGVRRVLELSGLLRIGREYATEEEALAEMG